MSDVQTYLADKPYSFVPLINELKCSDRVHHNRRSQDLYSGALYLEITIRSELHIGSGKLTLVGKNISTSTIRRGQDVIISGSSLKGVVRSIAETVSHSCDPILPDKALQEIIGRGYKRCSSKDFQICPTCSLFGMMGYKSKVEFGEFQLADNAQLSLSSKSLAQLESPFKNYPTNHDKFSSGSKNIKSYGNERLYYCQACQERDCGLCTKDHYYRMIQMNPNRTMKFRGRKFYHGRGQEIGNSNSTKTSSYEVINPGTIFRGKVFVNQLTKEELGLLGYSLGLGSLKTLRIGYGKPVGMGLVSLSLTSVDDVSTHYGLPSNLTQESLIDSIQTYETLSSIKVLSAMAYLQEIMEVNTNE